LLHKWKEDKVKCLESPNQEIKAVWTMWGRNDGISEK